MDFLCAGGSVVSTRCSETYTMRNRYYKLFGITLWNEAVSPRSVIQPSIHPGECWAFKGSEGYVVIELSARIIPTAFSIEHIPKELSPTGSIDSAPKSFSVWVLFCISIFLYSKLHFSIVCRVWKM